jgi:hypothetical protein
MKIIGCGCSWTHGFYWKSKNISPGRNKSYTEFLAETLSADVINLAIPGVSNYAIAKQVEYAISLRPDIIVFNTTTVDRIDLIKKGAPNFTQGVPTIRDFVHGRNKNDHIVNYNEIIHSRTFHFFVSLMPAINDIDNVDKIIEFILTYEKYINYEMRLDQNRFLLMGTLALLERSKIPHVCIDMYNILPLEYGDNVINSHYKELASNYNIPEDEHHFNQDGHEFLSDLIHQKLIDLKFL